MTWEPIAPEKDGGVVDEPSYNIVADREQVAPISVILVFNWSLKYLEMMKG